MSAKIYPWPLLLRDRINLDATPRAVAAQLEFGECIVRCPACASREFMISAPAGRIFCAECHGEIRNWRVTNPSKTSA